MKPYTIEPLTQTFGATIDGLDLREPVDQQTAGALVGDLLWYRVLVLRGQRLGHEDQVRFSKIFGPLDVYPVAQYVVSDFPEVMKISNIFENGEPIGLYDGDEQEEWHTDYSWKKDISRASLLYSVVAPDEGGDTVFADTTAAYADLPEAVKQRIDGLHAVHSMAYLVDQETKVNPHKQPLTPDERLRMPDVEQPLVRHHPVTGSPSLLLGSMIISGIAELGPADGSALLRDLHVRATADKYLYRHRWSVGDLVIWDNHATMHTRTPCDHTRHHRLLYRTTVL